MAKKVEYGSYAELLGKLPNLIKGYDNATSKEEKKEVMSTINGIVKIAKTALNQYEKLRDELIEKKVEIIEEKEIDEK
jgi:hypothetical protein